MFSGHHVLKSAKEGLPNPVLYLKFSEATLDKGTLLPSFVADVE